MNVLHVITGLSTGGAQMALCKLVEQQSKDETAQCVIALMKADGTIRGRIVAAGGCVDDLGLQRGQVSLRAAVRLIALTRQHAPQLIHGWGYHGNVAASIAGWSLWPRCPVVWGIRHSILDLSNEKPTTRHLIRLGAPLSRTTAAIVYCSRASAHQHERIGYDAGKTVVIPNGFDCEVFRPRAEARSELHNRLNIPTRRAIIGHMARFDPMKDHGNLIAAVARLTAVDQNVHLVMVGAAVESGNRKLAAMIGEAAIGARVSLLGERADVPALMRGFDVLALSSSTGEAFPNVLGEAMASGVPCVATDLGDCAWIVGDTGVVVPPCDAEALAQGLQRIICLSDEQRHELGARARGRVLQEFAIGRVVRRYDDLYRRIFDGARQ